MELPAVSLKVRGAEPLWGEAGRLGERGAGPLVRRWALRLVLSLVPGEEARGVFEEGEVVVFAFCGVFFGVVVAQMAARDGQFPPPAPLSTDSDGRRARS